MQPQNGCYYVKVLNRSLITTVTGNDILSSTAEVAMQYIYTTAIKNCYAVRIEPSKKQNSW